MSSPQTGSEATTSTTTSNTIASTDSHTDATTTSSATSVVSGPTPATLNPNAPSSESSETKSATSPTERRPKRNNNAPFGSPSFTSTRPAPDPSVVSQEQYAAFMQSMMANQPPSYFSLDVECVATGPKHNERAVAQIALVDQWERVVLNFYVKPHEKVFSYLPLLTGLSEQLVSTGIDLDAAVSLVKSRIPPNAILVGQNILKDVTWLKLQEGRDFGSMLDLSGLWRVFNEKYNSYSYFSLQHQAKSLLGILQEPPHNAATDAILSIRLYNLYRRIEHNPGEMDRAHKALLNTALDVSFAKQHPEYEGVCMGNKKTCTCGAPFFF